MSNKTKPFTQINLEDLAGLRGLGASSILVYMALRIYGGKDSTAWPSQDRIALDVGLASVTVRKAIKTLKQRGYIIEMSRQGKTKTYQIGSKRITDPIGSPIQTDPQSDPNGSLDRSDRIKTPIQTDPQIYKEYIKENIHLIDKTHSTPNQIDTTDNKKRESNDSLEMDELDLLFAELWNKHSITHGMTAKSGNPIQDWKQVKSRVGIHQAKRGLKTLDLKMSASGRPWQSFAGGRWILKLEAWIKREDDKPIDRRDSRYLSGSIEVDRRDLNKYRQEAREAKEANERAQAIALEPDTAARGLWRDFRLNNEEWCDLVEAVQKWRRTFLTDELRKEIESDPQLEDFAMIINI